MILKTINKALSPEQSNVGDRNNPAQRGKFSQYNALPKYNFTTSQTATQQAINQQLLLNSSEQAIIMRQLLQLPQDIRQLLATLLSKDGNLSPESLKNLLENNSKEVISKLIKLIQQSPNNKQNQEQLKQLISLLNQITPGRDASPQETITQFLLLYLPWLPLFEQQKIEVAFEKKESGEEPDESVALVIFISTINLGRFKIIIFINKQMNMEIVIQNVEGQEKEVLKNILKAVKQGIKEEKITADTHMTVVKQKNFEKSQERKITFSQVNNISPLALVAAKTIAQVIFEFDEKASLLENREKKVQE